MSFGNPAPASSIAKQGAAASNPPELRAPADVSDDYPPSTTHLVESDSGENGGAFAGGSVYSHRRRYADEISPPRSDDINTDVGRPTRFSLATRASLEQGNVAFRGSGGASRSVSAGVVPRRDPGQHYLDEFFDSSDYALLSPQMDQE